MSMKEKSNSKKEVNKLAIYIPIGLFSLFMTCITLLIFYVQHIDAFITALVLVGSLLSLVWCVFSTRTQIKRQINRW